MVLLLGLENEFLNRLCRNHSDFCIRDIFFLQSNIFASFNTGVGTVYTWNELREKSVQSAVATWNVQHLPAWQISVFKKSLKFVFDELLFLQRNHFRSSRSEELVNLVDFVFEVIEVDLLFLIKNYRFQLSRCQLIDIKHV